MSEDNVGTDDLIDEEVDLDDEAEGTDSADAGGEDLEFLDINQFVDKHVKVKVDGEEIVVPLSEAVAGYQRNADYTRKTQALAQQKNEIQWANALKGALENDPAGTIQLLANQFGVQQPQASAPQQSGDENFADIWGSASTSQGSVDPRYQELEGRLRAFEEQQAQQNLERTINLLSQKYGEEFDPNEVVAAALSSGSTDLEATFKQIKFDKVMEDAKAAKAAQAARAAKVAAKKAAAVVEGGSAGKVGGSDSGSVLSISDAWRQAKRELGG